MLNQSTGIFLYLKNQFLSELTHNSLRNRFLYRTYN